MPVVGALVGDIHIHRTGGIGLEPEGEGVGAGRFEAQVWELEFLQMQLGGGFGDLEVQGPEVGLRPGLVEQSPYREVRTLVQSPPAQVFLPFRRLHEVWSRGLKRRAPSLLQCASRGVASGQPTVPLLLELPAIRLRQPRREVGPGLAEGVLVAQLDQSDARIGRAWQAAVFIGVCEVIAAEVLEQRPHARLEVDQVLAVAHRVGKVFGAKAFGRGKGAPHMEVQIGVDAMPVELIQ